MKHKNTNKADAAPAPAGNISLRDALLEIGRMAQARKSCIRMPNGMMLDNYIGQILATKPEQPQNIAPVQSGQHSPGTWKVIHIKRHDPVIIGEHKHSCLTTDEWRIVDSSGEWVSYLATHKNPSTLERIVHVYNCYGELLEALKAVSRLDYLNEHNALANQVRTAIAKAEANTI